MDRDIVKTIMNFLVILVSSIFLGNLNAAPVSHSHDGRSHMHSLPVLKMHKHNGVWMDNAKVKFIDSTAIPMKTNEAVLLKKRCDNGDEDACRHIRYEKRCNDGQLYACAGASLNYEMGKIVKKNYPKVIFFHEALCKLSASSCVELGDLYEEGKITPKNLAKAAFYFEQACYRDDIFLSNGCSRLAQYYEIGIGVKQDYIKARSLYRKACDTATSLKPCFKLAVTYTDERFGKKNYPLAKSIHQNTCNKEHMESCYYLALLYMDMRVNASIEPDLSEAKKLMRKVCEGSNIKSSCEAYEDLERAGIK